ncbi:unnamed protein product, partial [Laminaria digitata]
KPEDGKASEGSANPSPRTGQTPASSSANDLGRSSRTREGTCRDSRVLSVASGRHSLATGRGDRARVGIGSSPPLSREVKAKTSDEKRAAGYSSATGGRRKSGQREPSAGGLCSAERGPKGKSVENVSGLARDRSG